MKKIFSLALLLCAAVQGTLAQSSFGGGTGTANDPYLISSSTHWDQLGAEIVKGASYIGTYFKLDADITVTTMLGTGNCEFSGSFDGNGKTLTFNCGSSSNPFSEEYCAPFRYINLANFSNLTVKGTIYTSNKFAAGFAGKAIGQNSFSNCVSNITINSSVNGDGTHGGFVANIQGDNTSFDNCAFTGSLNGTDTHSWGGFVGWTEGNNSARVSFNNCLFYPSSQNVNNSGNATFSRGRDNHTKNITLEDSYYFTALGTSQGEQAYASADASSNAPLVEKTIAGISFFVEMASPCQPAASNITATSATISWNTMEDFTYQLRYREKTEYSTSFEDADEIAATWSRIDEDGDGHGWLFASGDQARSGDIYFVSESWNSQLGSLEPDNWLISPQLTFGTSLEVWMAGRDPDYEEHFAIYISTTGKEIADFTELVPETVTSNEYQEYTADLSNYDGQKGYIAIRHFNCTDQYYLMLDDFAVYDNSDNWTTVDNATSGTTITGLTSNTEYDYQVAYTFGGKTYYSPRGILTTIDDHIAPFDVNVTNLTSNTATIGWTAYAGNYNLRYSSIEGNFAKVTLNVPKDTWEDGTGYQMLLDAEHTAYGSIIPEEGGLTKSGDASADTYANFEYKIPENADGSLTTSNIIVEGSITIEIPAGTYDWCITNPTPNGRIWIASEHGNIGGRADDFTFEPGKHYTFTVTLDESEDRVDLTVDDIDELKWTTVNDISNTSYTLSGLEPNTNYLVQVQSNKDNQQSEWIFTTFTTADATSIGLLDNADNSEIIAANVGQERNVTLVDRTLWKDGSWNTLCLPFDLKSFSGTPLEGATIKELGNSATCNTRFDEASGTLYLEFVDAKEIEAGHAYIVKWAAADPDYIKNPEFHNVTIENEDPAGQSATSQDGYVTFVGTYNPVIIGEEGDNTILYLGDDNILYYPSAAMSINSFRAYFQLNKDLTAGDPNATESSQAIKAFHLNFGEEENGIREISDHSESSEYSKSSDYYFTLDGRRLLEKPKAKGLYIHNGQKVLIK